MAYLPGNSRGSLSISLLSVTTWDWRFLKINGWVRYAFTILLTVYNLTILPQLFHAKAVEQSQIWVWIPFPQFSSCDFFGEGWEGKLLNLLRLSFLMCKLKEIRIR